MHMIFSIMAKILDTKISVTPGFSLPLRGLTMVTAIALAACNGQPAGPLSGKVTVDGSTTLFPLSKAMGEAFRQANPAVQLDINFSSTGGCFKKFCDGNFDVAGASRPINAVEGEQCKTNKVEFIELAVAFDSLAVVVNPKNTFVDCLTVNELKSVWEPAAEGRATQWKQIREGFPTQPLVLFGPGKDSGTFDYFTLAIVGTESSSRSDYTKSEDDTVIVRGVAGDSNALGYLGYAYYQSSKEQLKIVAIDSGNGCVVPTPAAVRDGVYQPLARPLFIYVNRTAVARPEVKAFAQFYLAPVNAQYVKNVGYVPLPNTALNTQTARLEKGITGSNLGGQGSVTGIIFTWFDDDKERDRVRNELAQ